ncbi:phage tail sheath C-terminal domain-containing protein [Glaciimonas sp. PAMC28666]|uniref:phage tail sheath family protein n=1 Tax=Glaciimonas sp. PAMC28666 TaxID=2807626 RepID=UPI001964D5FD|nr:phage tail sheath C-terminal domain-containing protein [Glaciimonas sp. PAMC28666]QRX82523.1 phage tail sheath family protein [Glaciimonas sp. PAMC28666]
MAAQYKTPGVYVVEENAFPNSVVEVATAVPAFIGCTEKALRGIQSLQGIPTRITSLAQYTVLFGGPPTTKFSFVKAVPPATAFAVEVDATTQSYFYNSLCIFFANGGGACWIVSVGLFGDLAAIGGVKGLSHDTLCLAPLSNLLKQAEPTMVVMPDAVLLSLDDWQYVSGQVLLHCVKMQSRIAIFDVYHGDQARTYDATSDVISGTDGFRDRIAGDGDTLNYCVAYYPWLNTSIVDASEVDYSALTSDTLPALIDVLNAEAITLFGEPAKLKKVTDLLAKILTPVTDSTQAAKDLKTNHQQLNMVSPTYQLLMAEILMKLNVLPPSGAIAGVYTRTDNGYGVFKAPANVTIYGAVSPVLDITHDDQEDLNVPLDGKAINAIRAFPGRGLLIWGARTLDGNSQDWRYINVRRTMIMLEQSIKIAAETYMFAANNAQTWVTVKSMIINFLTSQWKAGALQGAKPEDAFSVDVGLGSTMDANDILDGYMRIMVKVALVHPAEFIVITFQQQMAKS